MRGLRLKAITSAMTRRPAATSGAPSTVNGTSMKLTTPGRPQRVATIKAISSKAIAGHAAKRSSRADRLPDVESETPVANSTVPCIVITMGPPRILCKHIGPLSAMGREQPVTQFRKLVVPRPWDLGGIARGGAGSRLYALRASAGMTSSGGAARVSSRPKLDFCSPECSSFVHVDSYVTPHLRPRARRSSRAGGGAYGGVEGVVRSGRGVGQGAGAAGDCCGPGRRGGC